MIKSLPWTYHLKKIGYQTLEYSTQYKIQGHTCKNATCNISTKKWETFTKQTPKVSKQELGNLFSAFYQVVGGTEAYPTSKMSLGMMNLEMAQSSPSHPVFRHGVTKTPKPWYALMGGNFGNLFKVIQESHRGDDSQGK